MAISAIASHTRSVPISATSLHSVSLGAKASSVSLYRSQCLVEQRRAFFGWGRCRGTPRHPHADARYKRAMEKSDRIFSRHFRPYGRKPEWYRGPFQYDDGKQSGDWRRLKRSRGSDGEDKRFHGKWADPWFSRHDSEWNRMEDEFHRLRKAIDDDPYGMVFGRRLHPFPFGQRKGPWSTFFHDVLGFDGSGSRPRGEELISVKPAQTVRARSTKTEAQPDKQPSPGSTSGRDGTSSATPMEEQIPAEKAKAAEIQAPAGILRPPSTGQEVLFQFDPISGRMVPRPPKAPKQESEASGSKSLSDRDKPVTASQEEIKSDTLVLTGALREKRSAQVGEKNATQINETGPESVKAKGQPSSKPTPPTEGKKEADERGSWTRASQAILGDIKDYITSKIDAEPETPDTRRWPYLLRKKSDARISMHDAPLASTNYRQDPEAEELENLRSKDVRASFKRREVDREKVQEKPNPLEEHEDIVEEPVRLDEPLLFGFGNASAVPEHTPGQTASEGALGRKEEAGTQRPVAAGAAIISTDWGPVLEEQMHQIYEQTQAKTASGGHEQVVSESEKGALAGEEQRKSQVAAISTDILPPGTMEKIAQAASAKEASKSPEAAAEPVLLQAQHNQIDRLLMDIERANDAAAALMGEIKEGIQGQRTIEKRLETKAEPASKMDTTRPSYYKVLAYDVLNREIKGTSMASGSSVPFEPVHPADAISRLDYPAKFLPYISKMEAQGYELFSGGREVLVFKKMREASTAAPGSDQSQDIVHSPGTAAKLEQEAIDEVESAKPGSKPPPLFAPTPDPHSSPNAASVSPTSPASESSSRSSAFEGVKSKDKSSRPVRRVVRRMVLGGIVTGGTLYAIGVVVEYFKTGGQDGLGPRGFTGLEGR